MKKVREIKAQAIEELCAWIVPTLKLSEKDSVYQLRVHNGRGLPGDFEILSSTLDKGVNFLCGDARTPQPTWQAQILSVDTGSGSDSCPIGPVPEIDHVRLEIRKISAKYVIDKSWRVAERRIPVLFK